MLGGRCLRAKNLNLILCVEGGGGRSDLLLHVSGGGRKDLNAVS